MEEKPSAGIRPHLDKLTLGVTRILETSPGVSDVTLVEKKPADRHAIISWEQCSPRALGGLAVRDTQEHTDSASLESAL